MTYKSRDDEVCAVFPEREGQRTGFSEHTHKRTRSPLAPFSLHGEKGIAGGCAVLACVPACA